MKCEILQSAMISYRSLLFIATAMNDITFAIDTTNEGVAHNYISVMKYDLDSYQTMLLVIL